MNDQFEFESLTLSEFESYISEKSKNLIDEVIAKYSPIQIGENITTNC